MGGAATWVPWQGGGMALLHTVGSVVRLPLRVAEKVVGTGVRTVGAVVGRRSTPAPTPDVPARETPRAPARKTPPRKTPAAKAQAAKASAAKSSAKRGPATGTTGPTATARKAAVPERMPDPVTDIDAAAEDDHVDVTPADVADTMGSQLDDRPPSPS